MNEQMNELLQSLKENNTNTYTQRVCMETYGKETFQAMAPLSSDLQICGHFM